MLGVFEMLYQLSLAVNTLESFPKWLQIGACGFTLGAGICGGACIYHITSLKDDIKRSNEVINNLKGEITKLKYSKSTSTFSSNTSQAQTRSTPQICFLPATLNNLSFQDIKNEAFVILSEIHKTIESISIKTSDLENKKKAAKSQSERYQTIEDSLQKSVRGFIPQNLTEIENMNKEIMVVESEAISKFNQNYISRTIQIRNVLIKQLPGDIGHLPVENYINLKTLVNLRDIEKDIENLVQHI